jgi:hypothetical protein
VGRRPGDLDRGAGRGRGYDPVIGEDGRLRWSDVAGDRGNPYVFTAIAAALTATFHAANIVGAVRTARFANERARQRHAGPAEDALTRFAF